MINFKTAKLDGLKEENGNILRSAEVILKRRLRNHSEELAGVLRDHEESKIYIYIFFFSGKRRANQKSKPQEY